MGFYQEGISLGFTDSYNKAISAERANVFVEILCAKHLCAVFQFYNGFDSAGGRFHRCNSCPLQVVILVGGCSLQVFLWNFYGIECDAFAF